MNVVEKANEVSVFGRWASTVSQVTSPWEYSIRRNVPAFTKNLTDDSTKVWSASSNISWILPRLGLLRDVFFRVDIDLTDALNTAVIGSGANPGPRLNAVGTGIESPTAANAGVPTAAALCMIHPGGILKLFSQFELRARNREIARMYPENVYYHYMDQVFQHDKSSDLPNIDASSTLSQQAERISKINFADGLNLWKIYHNLPKTGDAVSTGVSKKLSMYIQIPFSYFQRMGNAFLTSFAEDISFHLICNSTAGAEALGPLGDYLTAGKIQITPWYHWIQPRPEEMAKLRQQMLAASTGIPRLQFSCLSEGYGVSPSTAIVANTSSQTQTVEIKLNCTYPVARTLFWIQSDVGLAGQFIPRRPDSLTIPINSVKVSGSGTTFLTLDEPMLLQQMVEPPYSKVPRQRLIYAINWSLLDKNVEMGGFLPTRNLNNLTMSVEAFFPASILDAEGADKAAKETALGAAIANPRTKDHYKLRVIHEYYVIEQTVPSNGQINVSAFD